MSVYLSSDIEIVLVQIEICQVASLGLIGQPVARRGDSALLWKPCVNNYLGPPPTVCIGLTPHT